jgi:hypothetical protein
MKPVSVVGSFLCHRNAVYAWAMTLQAYALNSGTTVGQARKTRARII